MAVKFRLQRAFDVVNGYYGGNQLWYQSHRNRQTGCGPVALSNAFAWFTGLSLDEADMKALQEKVQNYLQGPVLHPRQFIRAAKNLFASEGYSLEADYITLYRSGSVQRKKLILFIAAQLEENRPPALLLGPNAPASGKPGEPVYHKDFSNHWVLVTGLDVDGDDGILHVSSWGNEFHLALGDLLASKLVISCVSLKLI